MTLLETLDKLSAAFATVEKTGNSFGETEFFKRPESGKWSAAEHVQHLFVSVKPLVGLFGKPELMLQFGKCTRPTMNYDRVVELYHEKLNSPAAVPIVSRNNVEGLSPKQGEQMENLHSIHSKFLDRAATLPNTILDEYQIPHPLMGLLTAREFIFFTHYHTLHHNNTMVGLL